MTSVFSSTIAGKAWFATAAVILAVVQVSTGARIFGKLQRLVPIPRPYVNQIHRWSGRLAIICTLPLVGGTLFAVLVTLWATSAYWYFTQVRFGF